MKILYFFLILWVIFSLMDQDPDPATQINADPDSKPWFAKKRRQTASSAAEYYH
jgi:hypothetical protein